MMVQSSGMAKLPPACTVCLATRPIIHSPLPSTTTTATLTAAKNRCSTSCIRRTRCGGSSDSAAGRKKKWANTMPPIHTMMDRTWASWSAL
ncbi:hypothetical protein D3C87_1948240 [compost metagenome]